MIGSIQRFVGGVATHLAECILQHGVLLIEVVDRLLPYPIVVHRTFQEEAQEVLNAITPCTGCEIDEQTEIKTHRCCQDRVATKVIDLDLHGIAHPAEDVDIIPRLLIILTWRVVVDAHLVVVVLI